MFIKATEFIGPDFHFTYASHTNRNNGFVSTVLIHFSAGLGRTFKSIQGPFSLLKLATKALISETCSAFL